MSAVASLDNMLAALHSTGEEDEVARLLTEGAILPIGDASEEAVRLSVHLPSEANWPAVDALFAQHGVSKADLPEAWSEDPLTAWCWLVLAINGIEHDPEVQAPLQSYGIDLRYASPEVRRFTFIIA